MFKSHYGDFVNHTPSQVKLVSQDCGHDVSGQKPTRQEPSRSVPAATPRRLWATTAAVLGLGGVVAGGLALRRSVGPIGAGKGKKGAIVALLAGVTAAVNGGLNLAVATGGLGSGNGVAGGAAALVLGLVAVVLGGLALARPRRTG